MFQTMQYFEQNYSKSAHSFRSSAWLEIQMEGLFITEFEHCTYFIHHPGRQSNKRQVVNYENFSQAVSFSIFHDLGSNFHNEQVHGHQRNSGPWSGNHRPFFCLRVWNQAKRKELNNIRSYRKQQGGQVRQVGLIKQVCCLNTYRRFQ